MASTGKVWRPQGGDELRVERDGTITNAGTQASAISDITVTGTYADDDSDIETAVNAILDALRGVGIIASS